MNKSLSLLGILLFATICSAQSFRTYEGKIIDTENGQPLPFVKIQLTPSNIGTLSNSDGAFILKVPEYAWSDELVIQHLGYDVLKVSLNQYPYSKQLEVQLTPRTYELEAVVITPQDPRDLIEQALKNFPANHPFYTRKVSAFYRETSSINDTILDIAEAVVDGYVYSEKKGGAYKSKVKPLKIRKLSNRGPNDTLMDIDLTGSNLNPALQKRPDDTGIGGELELKSFLNPETFKFYTYEIKGVTEFYGRQVYIIHFDQDKRFGSKLYKGEIYLDMRTLAFARVKFAFSDKGKRFRFTQLQEGFKMGLMKGLLRMGGIQIDIRQHSAQIDYEYHSDDGLWHKHFVSEKFHVWIKLPSWIFNLMLKQSDEFSKKERKEMVSQISNTYSIQGSSELLITGIEKSDAVPKGKEWDNNYNPLKENLVNNDDPFWQNYNYIKPSNSLQNMESRIRASVKR